MITGKNTKWYAVKQFFRRSPKKQAQPPGPAEASLPADTPEWKQQILADFSQWLDTLPEEAPPAGEATVDNCDMYTLLSEFTALRQEIRFQNREQNRTTASMAEMQDAYEKSLALFEKSARNIETLAIDIRQDAQKNTTIPFLDVRDALVRGDATCRSVIEQSRWYQRTPRNIRAIAEGYEMAIRRFDRALSYAGITPVKTVGHPFDPKQMKAMGRQSNPDVEAGIVLAEEAGGFVRNGEVIRTAEVIVNDPTKKRA